jgi:hypothetical protein
MVAFENAIREKLTFFFERFSHALRFAIFLFSHEQGRFGLSWVRNFKSKSTSFSSLIKLSLLEFFHFNNLQLEYLQNK